MQNKVQARIGKSQAQNIENSLAHPKLGRYDARSRGLQISEWCPVKTGCGWVAGVDGLKARHQAGWQRHGGMTHGAAQGL